MARDSQGHPGASSKGVSRAGPSWGIPRRRLGRAHPRPPELRASLPQDLLPGPGEPSAPGDAAQRHPVRRARATPGRLLRRQQAAAGPRGPGLGHHPALQLQAVRGVCQRPGHGEGLGWHPWGVQESPQHLGVSSTSGSPVPQFSSGSGATLVPQQSGPPVPPFVLPQGPDLRAEAPGLVAGDSGQLQGQVECPQLQPARQRHPAGTSWRSRGASPPAKAPRGGPLTLSLCPRSISPPRPSR